MVALTAARALGATLRPGRFYDDLPGHVGVYRAEIFVFARRGEGLRKLVVGIERRRFELPVLLAHRVRAVVVVGPGYRRAGSDDQHRRRVMEVVDLHADRVRRGRGGGPGLDSDQRRRRTQSAE